MMDGGSRAVLHAADYAVFAATLLVSVGIGVYYAVTGGRQKTTSEFLMADRELKVLPVALSMFMSNFSAIYILGTAAEMYQHGTQFWISMLGYALGYSFTAQVMVPLYHPLKLTSCFEYINWRFKSHTLRVVLAIISIVGQFSYMGLAMFAPATALESVTGFPIWATIVISGVVTTIYTSIGGMKAVIWTDVFQGVVMLGGVFCVLVIGAVKVGGLNSVWKRAYDSGRVNFFNFNPDPTVRLTFWPCVIGYAFSSVGSVGTSQPYIQRFCALPRRRQAQIAMYIMLAIYIAFASVVCLCGLVMFSYFDIEGCDPLRSGTISNANQLLPYFVVKVIPYPGFAGLFMSVLFSGALSSMSSSLNAMSAITWKDLLEPIFYKVPESRKALISKIAVVLYGTAGMGMAFLFSILSGHVMVIATRFLLAIASVIFGSMILGCFIPCANWKGSVAGAIASVAMTAWVNIGSYLTVPHRAVLNTTVANCSFPGNTTAAPIPTDPPNVFWLYRVSFGWAATLSGVSYVVVGVIVSYLTGPEKPSEQDPRLVVPLFDRVCCCLPKPIRKLLWCGVPYDEQRNEEEKDFNQDQQMQSKEKTIFEEPQQDAIPGREMNSIYYVEKHQKPYNVSVIQTDFTKL